MQPRFHHESDNGHHYVVDRYADPLGDESRTDVESKRNGRFLAKRYNADPPWPVWDTIQAERDGYPVS